MPVKCAGISSTVASIEIHFTASDIERITGARVGHCLRIIFFNVVKSNDTGDENPDSISDLHKEVSEVMTFAGGDHSELVGSTKVLLEGSRQVCRLEECTMGNTIADAMFAWFASLKPLDDSLWGPVNGALFPARQIYASIDEKITQGR